MAEMEDLIAEVRLTNRWLRILALPVLRATLAQELQDPLSRRIYQASDGRAMRDVAKSAAAGFGTVQRHWQSWASKGVVETTDIEGRYRRLIDLREIGLGAESE